MPYSEVHVCVCAYRRRAQRRPKFCTAWPAVVLLSLPVSAGSQLQLLQLCGDGAQPHRLAGLVQRPQVVPLHLMQLKGACGEAAPALGANAGASLRQGQAHSWAAASVTAPPLPACLLGMCCRWRTARRTTRHNPASAALIHAVMPLLLHKPKDHSKPHLHQVLFDAPVAAAPERGQREGKGRLVTMHVLILIKQSEVGTHQRLRAGGSRFEGVDG